jgi:fusobacterium outer membrane protein
MTKSLLQVKKDLKAFAKRCKDFKYTDSALFTFLLCGMLLSVNLFSAATTDSSIENQVQKINTSISQIRTNFKRAKIENNKLIKGTNLELIQLMEQGDQVVKEPFSSWQFGINYFHSNWGGTYKGRGNKTKNVIYQRDPNNKFGNYTGADYGRTSLKRVIEPISAIPVDAAVKPKSITINAIAGADAPVITTPILNVSVSSVTPSTASVPSITPPTVKIPNVTMKPVSGFTLVFPNSADNTISKYGTNSSTSVNLSNSDPKFVHPASPSSINYISYHQFAGNGFPSNTTDATVTMTGTATANNIDGTNFYGGGSRFAYVDDVRNANGSKRVSSPGNGNRITFTLLNNAEINLVGPVIAGIVNEETSYTDGDTTTNITNSGSISDEGESLVPGTSYTGTLRVDINTAASSTTPITVNSKGKTGYKVGIAQTTEETIHYTSGTYYELFNGNNGGSSTFFNVLDTSLKNAVDNVKNVPNFLVTTNGKNTNIAGNAFSQNGVIHFSGDYSTGIQVASALRPNAFVVDPSKYSNNNSRSLVRADNKENGYIQLDGSHSYGMKLSGTALHVDSNDYAPSSLVSYVANNGLILISGSYDTAINGNSAKGSSAGIAKLSEAKWSSLKTIFNNGKIYVGGNNNAGILLESIYDDIVTNNGIITIDKAYNLFNNPNSAVNYSNAVATSNAGIRLQSYNTADAAQGSLEGVNKREINIKNGSGNVGIYALDVANTNNILGSHSYHILGENTTTGKINIDGTNVGMMAQDDSGTTNFKTIIKNSGTINVGGKNSIGMYTKDKDSYAEHNGGTIAASANNVGIVNNGHFDFTGGIIKAEGTNSVGVYSANGTNSVTTLGSGTLNVSKGGVGLYANDNSTQTLKGLTATVTGTDEAGSILFYNIPTTGKTRGHFDLENSGASAGNATIGAYSFVFYTNENLFSGGGLTFAQFLDDWKNGGTGNGINLTMNTGSSLLLADVSDAANKNVLFSNITPPITGTTLKNNNGQKVATLSGDYQYLTVKGADVKIDEANYDLSNNINKLNKVSIYDSNITVENGKTIHDGATPNVSASTNLINQGYILGVNNGRTLTNKGTITLNSTSTATPLKTLVAIGTDGKAIPTSSKAVNEGSVTSKINDEIGIYVGNGAVGTNNSTGTIAMDGIKAFGMVGSKADTENKGNITINGVSSIGMYSIETSASPLHKVAKNTGTITTTGNNNIAMVGNYSNILNDTTGIIRLNNSTNNVGMYTSAGTSGAITNNGTIVGIDGAIGIYGTDKVILGNTSSTTVGDSGVAVYSDTGDVTVNSGAKIKLIKGGTGSTPADNATGLFIDNSNGTASTVNINVYDLVQSGLGKKSYGYFFKDVDTLNYTNTNGSNAITLDDGSIFVYSDATNGNVHNTQDLTSVDNGAIGIYQKGGTITNAGKLDFTTGTKNTALYTSTGTATNQSAGTINVGTSNFGMVTIGGSIINDGKINITANKGTGMYSSSSNVTTNNGLITAATGITDAVGIYGKSVNNTSSGKITVGDGSIAIYTNDGNVTNSGNITVGKNKAIGVLAIGTNQNIALNGNISISNDSFGLVNKGTNNIITSSASDTTVGTDAVFIYQNDNSGKVTNNTKLISTGDRNYGLYGNGTMENYGTIDFSNGNGNVGVYSTGGIATNFGIVKVGTSNTANKEFGVGMATGYYDEGTGSISNQGTVINRGTIEVSKPNTMGMYAVGSGSKAINYGDINLSGSNTIGMYLDRGAVGENWGTIKTTASGLRAVKGIYLANGSYIKNYGTITIGASDMKSAGIWADTQSAAKAQENAAGTNPTTGTSQTGASNLSMRIVTADDMKEMGGVTIKVPPRSTAVTVTDANGNVIPIVNVDTNTPLPSATLVTVTSPSGITTLDLSTIGLGSLTSASEATSLGMYVDTSGVNYTNPIQGISNLAGLEDINLFFGSEAAKYTTAKAIEIGDNILKPYNDALAPIVTAGTTLNSTAASLTWMAQPTKNAATGLLDKVYLVKIPYTTFAKAGDTQTYNFLAGLEERYGAEGLGTKEKSIFDKLNSLTGGEGHILAQAIDEMKGHQYSNIQQRMFETGGVLSKEFNYLQDEWRNPSKNSNKIKVFGQRGEFKTNTAGVVDYANNAYGVAYVHENEKIKLGNKSGWYAGSVYNKFKFKDIGKSQEEQTMIKAGVFKTMSPKKDYNGSLTWKIAGEAFAGRGDMKRRYWIVDEVFEAKGKYTTYGIALKNEIGKEFRTSENTSIRPYGALNLEYGKYSDFRETGPMALKVKGNDYFSAKPEAGISFNYKQDLGVRSKLTASLTAAYENELGELYDVQNKAKLKGTKAPYYKLRGDKENHRGNGKFDLNFGWDNTRFGVTVNAGYDTTGENFRGGIGFRAIY